MRKWEIESALVQEEHVSLSIFIFMFFNHALQASVPCIILYWKVKYYCISGGYDWHFKDYFPKALPLVLKVDTDIFLCQD